MPFAITKLLAFLPFGNVLRGTTGKLILAAVLIAALTGAYLYWKHRVRSDALEQVSRVQLEQIIQQQQTQLDRLQQMQRVREIAVQGLHLERLEQDRSYQEILNRLSTLPPDQQVPAALEWIRDREGLE